MYFKTIPMSTVHLNQQIEISGGKNQLTFYALVTLCLNLPFHPQL